MTLIKLGKIIMQIGIICWIIQNCIFGWNAHPQSEAEKDADLYCNFILEVGIFLYLYPSIKLYESAIKKMER